MSSKVSKNPLSNALQSLTIDDLTQEIDPRIAYFVTSDKTVEDCIQYLTDKKILACPAVDDKKKVVGMVDVFDILSTLIELMPEEKDLKDEDALERSYRAVNLKKITEVLNKSGKNPCEPMYHNTPALEMISMFADGLHRVPVLDDKEDLIVTVSQSLVVKYLTKEMKSKDEMIEFGKKSLSELFLGKVQVKALKSSDSVLKAFKIMNKHGFSSIPIVGDDDQIVGNFSNSDVKGFCKESIPSFFQTIGFYLEKQSEQALKPVTCKADDSLVSVMEKLSSGPHRVWVVDEKNRPVSVVSMTDIFKLLRDHQ
eukprot:gene3318-5758_t